MEKRPKDDLLDFILLCEFVVVAAVLKGRNEIDDDGFTI